MISRLAGLLCVFLAGPSQAACGWANAEMMQTALEDTNWSLSLKRWAKIEGNAMNMRRPERTSTLEFDGSVSNATLDDTVLSVALAPDDGAAQSVSLFSGNGSTASYPVGNLAGTPCENAQLPSVFGIGRTTLDRRQATMYLQLRVADADHLIGILRVERTDAFGAPHASIEAVTARIAP